MNNETDPPSSIEEDLSIFYSQTNDQIVDPLLLQKEVVCSLLLREVKR